ncbi:MAG: GH116 family glycosyl hydrolase [Chloroflexota bacterium]
MPYHATMHQIHKPRSGITLGGIGTGGAELRPDGVFYNWHICSNWPLGNGTPLTVPQDSMLFFVVRYQEQGQRPQMKVLQLDTNHTVAAIPLQPYIFPWLSPVEQITYEARFPFAHLTFRDEQMPFDITLEAFSPFIPHDVKNSALPAIICNFHITSKVDNPVEVMLMASLRNAVGYDTEDKWYRTLLEQSNNHILCEMTCDGMATEHASFGSMSLASLSQKSSYYLGWEHVHPYYEYALRHTTLPNIDDTEGRNATDPDTGKKRADRPLLSTLAISDTLTPTHALTHTFIAGWHFPNFYSDDYGELAPSTNEGVYYQRFFHSAADVTRYVVNELESLSNRTRQFTTAFYDSSLPELVLDQVNSHLNTFISSSWLTYAGKFGIQEGMTFEKPWGPLSTIDVSLYGSIPTLTLFPELEQSTLRAHRDLQADYGQLSRSVERNFAYINTEDRQTSRIDMPPHYAILVLRCALWTNDISFLQDMWPSVKRALDYVLREREFDGDGLPDMTGVMSTYDNFAMYGASSYVGSLWLSALHHAIIAAHILGDNDTEQQYRTVLQQATPHFETKLWNGHYYRLYNDAGGARGDLDEGCLTDQLIGQWTNHFGGLGDLVDSTQRRQALAYIFNHSYDPEYGLRNCRWPDDDFLHDIADDVWVDQANTCWSGVELAFASLLIYEGMVDEGMQIIQTIDQRYRTSGRYFDHIEFGGHYYRAMSAWAILHACLGLSINQGHYRFNPQIAGEEIKLFFAFASGTAHYLHNRTTNTVTLTIHSGVFHCNGISIANIDTVPEHVIVEQDQQRIEEITLGHTDQNELDITFQKPLELPTGTTLRIASRST